MPFSTSMKRIIIIFFALILLVNVSAALDVNTYQTNFNIVGNKVVVEVELILNETTTGVLDFDLPEDYRALSLYIDSEPVPPSISNNLLNVELKEASNVSFNYLTQEFIDKTNFLMNMKSGFDVDTFTVKLLLSEGDSLKKPIKEGDISSGSIYPAPTRATTDGRSLIFYWVKIDMKKGDELSVFAQIEPRTNYIWLILFLVIILIVALVLIAYLFKLSKKKPKTRIVVKKEDMLEKHLKEDEEQIFNILKRKEGSCEQGTLRVITGFSKATLSRILKEMEDRKMIYKEKRGKKNLIFLKN